MGIMQVCGAISYDKDRIPVRLLSILIIRLGVVNGFGNLFVGEIGVKLLAWAYRMHARHSKHYETVQICRSVIKESYWLNFCSLPNISCDQWTSGDFGGFSSATPWLPIGRDHLNPKWNVKDAARDENSTLNLIKNMAEAKDGYCI